MADEMNNTNMDPNAAGQAANQEPAQQEPTPVEPEVIDVRETPQFKEYEAQQVANAGLNPEEMQPAQDPVSPMMADNPALKMQGNVTSDQLTETPVAEEPAPVEPVAEPTPAPAATPEAAPAQAETPAKEPKANKKGHMLGIMIGLVGILAVLAIGLSIFLFLPSGAELVGSQAMAYVLIMVVIGLVGTLGFVGLIMGSFKLFTAKKEDKKTKKKGFMLALVSTLTFMVSAVVFVIALLSFNAVNGPTGPDNIADLIITEPAELRNLTAPVEVSFDASGVPYNSEEFEVISYLWDFIDGNRATGAKVTHTFNRKPESGVYNVQLTILYRNLKSGEQIEQKIEKPVAILNQEALVDFTFEPSFGAAPIVITFDASESEDPDGDIVAYEWDFDGDDIIDDEGVTAEFEYQENGVYDVTLNVTDTNGEVISVTKQVELLEEGGFALRYEVDPNEDPLRANIGYQFDASSSTAPEARIIGYSWDFGDNTGAQEGRKVTHSYRTEGIYTLVLTVETDDGKTQSKEFRVQVGDLDSSPRPVITTIPAKNGNVVSGPTPLKVSFSGNESTDPNGDIVDYSWDFNGDGIADAAGANAEFTYDEIGTYRAVLTVTDADGNSTSAEVTVDAKERGVQAYLTAEPIAGETPLEVNFDASGTTTDPVDPVVTFEWNFGDGSPVRRDNAQLTYVYKTVGTYVATVKAITGTGKESTAQVTINVNPVSLKSCFRMSRQEGPAPLTIEFSAKCSRGVVGSYKWSFGDSNESIERQPVHTYTEPGTYEINLTVEKDGIVDSFTDTVEVQ